MPVTTSSSGAARVSALSWANTAGATNKHATLAVSLQRVAISLDIVITFPFFAAESIAKPFLFCCPFGCLCMQPIGCTLAKQDATPLWK
jgi:hypothetical protein